jgi:hypothetical protein
VPDTGEAARAFAKGTRSPVVRHDLGAVVHIAVGSRFADALDALLAASPERPANELLSNLLNHGAVLYDAKRTALAAGIRPRRLHRGVPSRAKAGVKYHRDLLRCLEEEGPEALAARLRARIATLEERLAAVPAGTPEPKAVAS